MTKSPPLTPGVPLNRSLHWLPVKFRMMFKTSLLTYKTLHEKQPVYLLSMLAPSLLSRSLRSNKGISLLVRRVKANTDTRGFHSCAPSLWNNLLLLVRSEISIATFKKQLKTHLFDLASALPSPIYTRTQDGSLMLQNCFIDFATEHRFGCHASEPGFGGNIGATGIWLIDYCSIISLPSLFIRYAHQGFQ